MSVTAPAANIWDLDDISARALAVLRMENTDVDAGRVTDAAEIATQMGDKFLDQPTPIYTTVEPMLVQGAVILNVEEYKVPGVSFGIMDAWSADTVPVRIGSDRLRSVRSLWMPFRARFGVG